MSKECWWGTLGDQCWFFKWPPWDSFFWISTNLISKGFGPTISMPNNQCLFRLTLLAHIFVEISKGFDTHYYIVKLPHLPSLQGPSFLGCTHVLAMCNTTDAYMLMPANVLNLKPLVLTSIPSDQGPLAICSKTALHMWSHLESYLVSEEVGPLWEWNGSKALIWIATLLVPKLSGPHYKSMVFMPDFVESSNLCQNLTLS